MGRARLDPSSNAVEGRAHHHDVPETSVVEQPHDRQDERDVGEAIDHGEPVNGHSVDAIEAHEDVADDAVLQPHEAIAHGVDGEEEKHDPTPFVQSGIHQWRRVLGVQDGVL